MDSKPKEVKPSTSHWVSSTDSTEFSLLTWALTHSPLVGLDAEWKPSRTPQPLFPTVSLLQIACRAENKHDDDDDDGCWVFLVDLLTVHLPSIWELLRNMFTSPNVLKLGFKFKQDLKYLSSTFSSAGCDPGFERMEPYLDITSVYYHLQPKQPGKKFSKDTKSLAAICKDVLGVSLSKKLQCSDWSCRPLTEEQKIYAAADAQCLLEIFTIFQDKVVKEDPSHSMTKLYSGNAVLGLKEILQKSDHCDNVLRLNFFQASDLVRSAIFSEIHPTVHASLGSFSKFSCGNTTPLDVSLSKIVRKYGEQIFLKESDKTPRASRRKGKRHASVGSISKGRIVDSCSNWQGPPPWVLSLGGDGSPKFLCDVMVEGLAKHLRCVGVDAAIPYSKRPEPRQLIDQADKEKRVLLTRDAKILRHDYLLRNQVYKVRSLLKNEQLLEVIETFQLKICEDRLMSRCTKCNGRFIQKPLTTEEAIEAAKGFQVIPNCLFKQNLEFWQCRNCNQVYWEGTQYHNAVQKFVDICKLNE